MTPLPTWADLRDLHCTSPRISENSNRLLENPYYEEFSQRRFNYSPVLDKEKFRFVFLKDVLSDPSNKTLVRRGRFVWCHSLGYEGRNKRGLRVVSFSVDRGQKIRHLILSLLSSVTETVFNPWQKMEVMTWSSLKKSSQAIMCISLAPSWHLG